MCDPVVPMSALAVEELSTRLTEARESVASVQALLNPALLSDCFACTRCRCSGTYRDFGSRRPCRWMIDRRRRLNLGSVSGAAGESCQVEKVLCAALAALPEEFAGEFAIQAPSLTNIDFHACARYMPLRGSTSTSSRHVLKTFNAEATSSWIV